MSLFTKMYNTCGLVLLRELEVFVKLLSVLDNGNEICDGMCRIWHKWNGNRATYKIQGYNITLITTQV